MSASRPGPLAGLKVVEIGHYIAGPFCTRILADLGAEVIKIEPPGGDPFRGWGAAVEGNSVWFSIHGRNKLSVVLDLKKDLDAMLALAARADVLVENLRAGQLERLRLGPDDLHKVNPRLVIARISGYGQDGPYRDKPAFVVGPATAVAARKAGFAVQLVGSGGLQQLLDTMSGGKLTLLRLAARRHVDVVLPAGMSVETRIVYAAQDLPVPPALAKLLQGRGRPCGGAARWQKGQKDI